MSAGRLSKLTAPALAVRPKIATAGNAAAATTRPASSPHTSSDAALVIRLWSRLRIQNTASGYVTPATGRLLAGPVAVRRVRTHRKGRVLSDALSLG